jgi:type II secretory pathway pseudopilin PulG
MNRNSKTEGHLNHRSRGFTLIAALLIMVLLSGLAVGLMYMASNEVSMGGNDQEQNLANYAAESGMEELTANLYTLYQSGTNPSGAQVQGLATQTPSSMLIPNITYTQVINYNRDANGNPTASGYNPVSSGPNQGLIAQIIPMTLQVTATRNAVALGSTDEAGGASVNITRRIEVSLIPVFQFGVFCNGDCDWFAGPNFAFGGRVHANGNLFLASGATLEFNDKIQAAGEIILDQLENNWPTNNGYQGTILVPIAAGGCPIPATFVAGGNCKAINEGYNTLGDASWNGGFAPKFGTANWPGFKAIAANYNGFYLNGKTGANALTLPFVQSNNPNVQVDQAQIVRKPLAGEVAGTNLSNSRLYNKAAIRILIADNIADLHPERSLGPLPDGQDIQLNLNGGSLLSTGPYAGKYMWGAMGKTGGGPGGAWILPTGYAPAAVSPWSLLGQATTSNINGGPWLRVEYLNTANPPVYVGVTQEWLNYGFGRMYNTPPTVPTSTNPPPATANPISPAILILQELQNGKLAGSAVTTTAPNAGGDPSLTNYNWQPINFYDAREGEPRDYTGYVRAGAAGSCNPIGVMNAVELDVGNLGLWLRGAGLYGAGSGKNVNSQTQNGYVLYFSDHRGMRVDPNPTGGNPPIVPANTISGVSGLEDTINTVNANGTADGKPEPAVFYTFSPEDLDGNNKLDAWGEVNLGNGFGINTVTANVYSDTIGNCATTGAVNIVTGARHVLRLVDGGMGPGNISYLPDSVVPPNGGGFTVASEEPVYVYGNYNTWANDPLWANPPNPNAQHAAAAIIADSVTLLTNNWLDSDSLLFPATMNCNAGAAERCGGSNNGVAFTPAYYRMAVASGKTIPFPNPAFAGANAQDFGTDGGMHNFLRYLEDMGNISINYYGSMVSLYYSQYATGVFKCCNVVYKPPSPRNYNFDTLFLNPATLPPGTPQFQDIVNLSYHQNFTPQ